MNEQVKTLKVQVWVFKGDEVLLLKTIPARGGGWQPVTGSAEPMETLQAAALRELAEETGLTVPPNELRDTGFEFEFESRWGGIAREHVWACDVRFSGLENSPITLDSSEHVAFKWLKIRQAEKFLDYESTKKALKMASKLSGKKN